MIKTLAACVRQYKTHSILSPVFVTLETGVEVVIPLLMARLIDYGIEGGDMSVVVSVGLIMLACAMAQLLFGALAGRSAAIASTGFAANLRHDMFYNVQDFSFSNIDRFSVASLVTRLTTDVTNVQNAYQMILRIVFRAPFMLIFALIASFSISPSLSNIFLIAIPILAALLAFISIKVHPIFVRVFKTYDHLNNVVQEDVRGIRVVKDYCREKFENSLFVKTSKKIFDDFSTAEKTVSVNMPVMQLCMYTVTLLIAWFGAKLIVASGNNPANGLSTGELLSVISYTMQILGSLMMISMIFIMLIMARASGNRIAEVLEEKSDITNPANPITEVKDGSIRFDHVSFSYSKDENRLCLADVDLNIPSGATVGILGGTGSSKSSLVQLIPRLYDVDSGRVLVGGKDVRDYDLKTLRDGVAMVLQQNVLFSGTVADNLRWGNDDATQEQIEQACKLAQADEFVEQFPDKYETHVEQGGSNVSGGQKQRLCIARALLKNPKILILDDSTSAVDMKTDALIRASLHRYIPDTTKIIIAQRVASVQDADVIIVMDAGRIVATGKHAELLETSEIYKEVYESQTKGGGLDG